MAERTYTQTVLTGMMIGAFVGTTDVNAPLQSTVALTQTAASDALIFALIERDAGVVGGSARIARTRIPVWTLENYRRLGATETQILEAFPALRRVDLQAARVYVALHAAEVEADIRANAAARA